MAYVGLNIPVADPPGGGSVKHDRVGNLDTPLAKMAFGAEGTITEVTAATPLPISFGATAISAANPLPVSYEPKSTGGLLRTTSIVAATGTNATSLVAVPARVYGVVIFSVTDTAPVYLRLFNKASAPSLGSDVPAMVIPIPGGGTAGFGNTFMFGDGVEFSLGIAIAITAAIGLLDATGLTNANRQIVQVLYR
jgi:hypothetical protein